MQGQVKRMIDEIIKQRSKGNETIALTTKTKLILKGLNPDAFGPTSPDTPELVSKVKQIAGELGVAL